LVPIVVLSLVALSLSTQVVGREVERAYTASLESTSARFETSLSRLELMSNAFATDRELNALNQAPTDRNVVWEYVRLSRTIDFVSLIHGFGTWTAVVLLQRDRVLSSAFGFETLPTDFYDRLGARIARRNGQWTLGTSLLAELTTSPPAGPVLEYVRASGSRPTSGSVIVVTTIPTEALQGFLGDASVRGSGSAFLADREGTTITSSPDLGFDVSEVINQNGRLRSGDAVADNRPVPGSDGSLRSIIAYSAETGLSLGIAFPTGVYLEPIHRIRSYVYAIAAVAVGLAVFFSIAANRSVLRPLNRLVDSMQQIQAGNMHVRMPIDGADEFGFVYRQFNTMAKRIRDLIDEVNLEHLRLQEAELKMLQSQINPHFLYNSLNFIYQMAEAQDHENVARMAHYLGRYFRFATRSGTNTVRLREELDNVVAYIEIQRLRYPNRIEYRESVPEDLKDVSVPRLLLQPLVENAFVHGLDVREGSGEIRVHGVRHGGVLQLQITDNGVGISASRLVQINSQLSNPLDGGKHIGLQNVAWRVRLRFGELGQLRMESQPGVGTTVWVTLPLHADDALPGCCAGNR
jgi:two-component system sensor histidine kinase YesM